MHYSIFSLHNIFPTFAFPSKKTFNYFLLHVLLQIDLKTPSYYTTSDHTERDMDLGIMLMLASKYVKELPKRLSYSGIYQI